ncbi:MAG: translocation/assembly module TamB domain-containing protein [Gammaproteobacteria bacterium]|nr:translocation/assembly module TamB domain-containing protein [Gammaproteobacteria bacterium]
MKWRYRIAIALGAVVVVIVTGIAVLFQTQAGLSWAVGLVEDYSDGALRIGSVRGTLAGPIQIKNLQLDLDGAVITVAQAKLDWSPTALAAGKIKVTRLTADHISVAVKPDRHEPSDAAFRLPEQVELSWHWIVDAAQLNAIKISMPQQQRQLVHVGFSLDASEDRIKLADLEIRQSRFELAGELRLEPHGEWKIAARLREQVHWPDFPTLTGRLRIDGNLRGSVALVQKVSAPFTASLETHIDQPLDQPSVQGKLWLAGLDLAKLRADWPALAATADIHFHGNAKNLNARGSLAVHGEQSAQIGFDLQAGLQKRKLRIAHLNLELLGIKTAAPAPESHTAPRGRLTLHGQIALDAPHVAHLEVAWQDLRWPPGAKTPKLLAPEGGASLDGTLRDWAVHALGRIQVGELSAGRWLLKAHGNSQVATITGLAGRWLDGRILAAGKLSLADRQAFRLRLESHGLDLEAIRMAAQLPQSVAFVLTAEGALEPLGARIELERLTGRLHGQTVTGHASLDWTEQRLVVNRLALAAGSNRLTLQGRWSDHPDIAWQLRAPELSLFAAGLGGHLTAQGTITGTRKAPLIEGKLSGEALHWRSVRIKQADAQAAFKAGKKAVASIDLALKGIQKAASMLGDLEFSLSGPADAQRFRLDFQGERGELHLAGSGRLLENAWRGNLERGRFQSPGTPAFRLQDAAEILLGERQLTLGRSCWQGSDQSRLCLAGNSDKQGWQIGLTLHALPLDLANPFLERMQVHGELDGYVDARGGNGRLRVLALLHAGSGSIERRIQGESRNFGFNEAGLEVRIDGGTAQARLGVLPSLGGMLDIRVESPWRRHEMPTGRLAITAHLPNLSRMDALSTAIDKLSGRLDADFSVSGSLEQPRFSGRIALSRAGFSVPRFGTRVKNARLTLRGEGTRLSLSGSMDDGKKGHLSLHGSLLRDARRWALDARVKGEHFLIANMPMARLVVSPELDIGWKNRRLSVKGVIAIPSADIQPPDFANAIAPSEDLVIVGKKTPAPKSPIAVQARITLRLGDKIHFSGFGVDARLGGRLTLIQEPHELATGTGEIRVLEGQYKAYGIKLKIVQGVLLFSGGWVGNPSVNMRAQRDLGTVVVGLHVTGSLRRPRMDIYSDPPMSESNALAYLLFGHGVRQNSGTQSSLQAQAANALGLAGATFLAESVGEYIGVDTVTVESASPYTTDRNQTSLFLGEYLTPRLYVSYGIGLYQPINLLRVHYTISRHWALRAVSGTISGADILYQIAF